MPILLESTTTSCYQWNLQMYSQSSLHGLTLTFDIDTCFCNGLDAYSNTWLQFVFPVYIWLLVGLMILVSHYLQSFANLLGNNRVSVLATLILLPYAKILHTLLLFLSQVWNIQTAITGNGCGYMMQILTILLVSTFLSS